MIVDGWQLTVNSWQLTVNNHLKFIAVAKALWASFPERSRRVKGFNGYQCLNHLGGCYTIPMKRGFDLSSGLSICCRSNRTNSWTILVMGASLINLFTHVNIVSTRCWRLGANHPFLRVRFRNRSGLQAHSHEFFLPDDYGVKNDEILSLLWLLVHDGTLLPPRLLCYPLARQFRLLRTRIDFDF